MPERCLRGAGTAPIPHLLGRLRDGRGVAFAHHDLAALAAEQEGGGETTDATTHDHDLGHRDSLRVDAP